MAFVMKIVVLFNYLPSSFSALLTTFSVVNPNSLYKTSALPEAPNLSIEITSPSSPTYLCQPKEAPASIASLVLTDDGNIDSLYS
mgnify:CR=1 FL=1